MPSFTQMHNDHLDPDRHLNEAEQDEQAAKDRQTVLDFFSATTEEACERRIYKSTACGAWIKFTESGVVIGSIVEGLDFGTATYPLHFGTGFTSKDIQDRIDAVEREASDLWDWGNVTYDRTGRRNPNGKTMAEQGCDAPDTSDNYRNFKQGERSG